MVDHLPTKRECSQKAVTSYRDALALLIDLLGRGSRHAVTLDDIDALSVEAFLDHPESRQRQRHLDEEPEAGRPELVLLPRARQEARFLLQDHARDGSAAQALCSPVMEYLTVAEVETLFSSIDDSTKHGLREKAMIGFPYETAARVGELPGFRYCQLRLGDVPTSSRTGREARQGTFPSQGDTRS